MADQGRNDCATRRLRRQSRRHLRQKQSSTVAIPILALTILAASVPATMAQQCISLSGSTACSAFNGSSISTSLSGAYPFLSYVSDLNSFDDRLKAYVASDYAKQQYQTRINCSKVDLTNTTNLYARYSTSLLCNALVQRSLTACASSANNSSRALCADSCADYATSEQEITSSPDLCGTPGSGALDLIRSDFTTCALPTDALSPNCITGASNEPNDCGYSTNLEGLCSYCGASSPNATDSCCVNANVEKRCVGVHLPTTTSMPPLFPSSTSSSDPTATGGAAAGGKGGGLSGGAIAGIVVGSIVGAAIILAAVIFCCIHIRRKRDRSQHGSILNTPSPTRQAHPGPAMSYTDGAQVPPPILPGARVARMSALEESGSSGHHGSRNGDLLAGDRYSSSDAYDSPVSAHNGGLVAGNLPKRDGSLSSNSALGRNDRYSPHSGSGDERNFSSPEGVASGQSEQLQFFKDYYSQDEIHANDTVATLWAYQPRANDEFELERGDMLKVVGIWDDGWATGVKLSETAEQWEARRNLQRDSGVSNGSRRSGVAGESEIKAFPLVCVCLPQHWRKTIEGDSTEATGSGPPPSP